MKQRFSALDIRATVSSLRSKLIGLRLQNVYDINAKTYIFKFAKPDLKELVLIESGIRIHTTQFAREKSNYPSNFCIKLRKHIRTRRLTNVIQLGSDRIVDFQFLGGEGGTGYHIIAEFYASGNIILTDHNYNILSLLRVVQPNENIKMAVGEIYDTFALTRDFQPISAERLKVALEKAGPKDALKKVLNAGLDYGPALSEHAITLAALDPNLKVATGFDIQLDSPQFQSLLEAFKDADNMIDQSKAQVPTGFIVLLQHESKQSIEGGASSEKPLEIYDEFHPFLFAQHKDKPHKQFSTFDAAVDEFFSAIESQKLDIKSRQQESSALKKLEAVRTEQEKRIRGLQELQLSNVRRAELIELNLSLVDAAILIIRNAIASTMDWKDLEALVNEEKKKGNPIALMIDKLKLETNQITLRLADPHLDEDGDSEDGLFDSDSDGEQTKRANSKEFYNVDVDIYLSAFANARSFYFAKKHSAMKQEKTIAASSKALKSAERKIWQDLNEVKITATIQKIRKPFWFEKFLWFISSENYLIIAGRDATQNEMIVKRYFKKDDIYVHADLHGAASVVIKNSHANQPVPPSTLFQAGVMSVCQSRAWDAKIVTSAYWVAHDQVSKTAPTGEYLTTGSFMIRGKKNFLPPVQLIYGFGYLFKLDDSSIANHLGERKVMQMAEEEEALAETNSNFTELDNDDENLENDQEEKIDTKIMEVEKFEDEMSTISTIPTTLAALQSDSESNSDDEAFPDTQIEAPKTILANSDTNTLANWEKYNLITLEQDEEIDEPGKPKASGGTGKRYLSARERRDMKKGIIRTDEEQNDDKKDSGRLDTNGSKDKKQSVPQPARGKKAKLRKIKDKYGDQDEEERELRMEILGTLKGQQQKKPKKETDKKPKSKPKVQSEYKAKSADGKLKDENTVVKEPSKSIGSEEATNVIIDDEDTKDVPQIEYDDENEAEEVRQLLKEENIAVLEAEEVENLSFLDMLTGNPLSEDILQFAIPVCAPYSALQKYKYKVKLTPGAMKKGKAIKQANNFFLSNNIEVTQREKDLIKSVPDMEAIGVMLGKVKVSAANLEASKKKGGKGRK